MRSNWNGFEFVAVLDCMGLMYPVTMVVQCVWTQIEVEGSKQEKVSKEK